MAKEWDNDVLAPYYAFILAVAIIGIALSLMPFAAREHGLTMMQYLASVFRVGPNVHYAVGHSSLDIFASGILASAFSIIMLGFLQLLFTPTVSVLMGLACSLGIRLLLGHKWSFVYRNYRPDTPKKLPDTLMARNRYQDVTQPFARVALSGIGQVLLLVLYVWSIFDNGRPPFDEPRSYVFYFLGTFLAMTYVVGNDLYNKRRGDFDFWQCFFYHVQTHRGAGHWRNAEDDDADHYKKQATQHLVPMAEADFRYFLDTMVNSMGFGCVQFGIPIQLASDTTPLDFVLNTIAAFFIIELDDSDDVTIRFSELVPSKDEGEEEEDAPSSTRQPPTSGFLFDTSDDNLVKPPKSAETEPDTEPAGESSDVIVPANVEPEEKKKKKRQDDEDEGNNDGEREERKSSRRRSSSRKKKKKSRSLSPKKKKSSSSKSSGSSKKAKEAEDVVSPDENDDKKDDEDVAGGWEEEFVGL